MVSAKGIPNAKVVENDEGQNNFICFYLKTYHSRGLQALKQQKNNVFSNTKYN